MANKSLPYKNPDRKKCYAPGCWHKGRKTNGLCDMHTAREKRGIPFDRPKYQRAEKPSSRINEVLAARNEGKTFIEIASRLEISFQRVQQICFKYGIKKQSWEVRNATLINKLWKRYLLGSTPRELVSIFKIKLGLVSKCLAVKRRGMTVEQLKAVARTVEVARFWNSVDKRVDSQECWEWQGVTYPTGYGRIRFQGRTDYAHRVAFEIHNDYRPKNCVLHSCDNPPCVNPTHLREGTMADNMQDRDRRGRAAWQKDYEDWREKLREGRRKRIAS